MGKKVKLRYWDKQILLQSMAVRCLYLFGRLEVETEPCNAMSNYFDKYYSQLQSLVVLMEHDFPSDHTSV